MRFSQRIGKFPVRNKFQIEYIDEILTTRLWNNILEFFSKLSQNSFPGEKSELEIVCLNVWKNYLHLRADEIERTKRGISISVFLRRLKLNFITGRWHEKYDLIEFLSEIDSKIYGSQFTKNCNDSLKIEMAGYRIIQNSVVQITSDEEIVELEEVLENTSPWKSVNEHLKTAIDYLSSRIQPDYRNSVKESISALESLCIILTGDRNVTLGKALKEIEKRYTIHKGLKQAFSALYGYASDSGGIRHSLQEDDIVVTFEDAKFVLVSCSAFINYLKVKMDKT
ncbi:hypothetical protein C9994_07780 [Marivirga lumbricoides]|uniref:HEPN AbiJ-N-terminal domain-containing protein n=1 Tax=Marivirga lumbricoides TaxID=1046115 RepID=A0A2T4DRH8_9BACT|nr:hypothetical protein C9994_07780 [Marivirga lumbricoides]